MQIIGFKLKVQDQTENSFVISQNMLKNIEVVKTTIRIFQKNEFSQKIIKVRIKSKPAS